MDAKTRYAAKTFKEICVKNHISDTFTSRVYMFIRMDLK